MIGLLETMTTMLNPDPVTYKTKRLPGSFPVLSGYSLLEVAGVDAGVFLQAQTMNDVRALAPGHWQWNGWLSAKGRVIALFALLRQAEDQFLLILPDFPAAELAPLLQRFVFRSKVRLDSNPAFCCAAEWPADGDIPVEPNLARVEADGTVQLDFSGDAAVRQLVLLAPGHPALGGPDTGNDERWRLADLEHGLPRLDLSQREAWTPQMLSLERLRAFSLKKGCYPGQEIVARTHFLGQAKRGLALLRGEALRPGDPVTTEAGEAAGTVVCATRDWALAVLHNERRAPTLRVGDRNVLLAELADGLARAS